MTKTAWLLWPRQMVPLSPLMMKTMWKQLSRQTAPPSSIDSEDGVETAIEAPPLHASLMQDDLATFSPSDIQEPSPQASDVVAAQQFPNLRAPHVEEEIPSVESLMLMRFELDTIGQPTIEDPQ